MAFARPGVERMNDDDEDDRPRTRPRRDDRDDRDDDRPRRRRRDDEDDRPRTRSRRRDDEDDDYEHDHPRRRRRKRSGTNPGAVIALILGGLILLGGIGYAAWRYVAERDAHFCRACTRPVHSNSKTVAVVDGKRGFYCCPACALSEHQQSKVPVDVIELADYLGGGRLAPNQSYVVRDSDVNACLHHQPAVNPDKQPMHSQFDRCAPSLWRYSIISLRSRSIA